MIMSYIRLRLPEYKFDIVIRYFRSACMFKNLQQTPLDPFAP
jgi:hypothetical protein